MENHYFINGETHYKWSFSIAMLNYQRVSGKMIMEHCKIITYNIVYCNYHPFLYKEQTNNLVCENLEMLLEDSKKLNDQDLKIQRFSTTG